MFDDIIIRPKKKWGEKNIIRESLPSNETAEKEMKKGEREDNISPKINNKGPGVNPNTRVKKAKVMKKGEREYPGVADDDDIEKARLLAEELDGYLPT